MRRAATLPLWLALACGAPASRAVRPAVPPVADEARPAAERLSSGRAALAASRYRDAEAHLRAAAAEDGPARGEAWLALAEALSATGRYDEAAKTARRAAELPGLRARAAAAEAEAHRRVGRVDEAVRVLERVHAEPEARHARLLLGELLLETGGPLERIERLLMTLVEDYNDGRIAKSDADGLALVGRAAHLLRSPHDANDAFEEAEAAVPGHVPTLLYRAALFLEKYDPGHAEEVAQEILARAPDHPDALVWLAHVRLAQALDFDAAEALARRALAVNPRHVHAQFVLAGISLRDLDLAEADRRIAAGLAVNARDLDLLSLRATVRFLADDADGFRAARARVFALGPRYVRFYHVIGDFADWEHRYDELVALMREAVQLDPRDGRAHGQLGLNLLRAGDDSGALLTLRTAFDLDPFDVRVFNTLDLLEKRLPRDYVSVDGDRFRIRYPKADRAVLERYVPPLLDEAWRTFSERYGFEPAVPVGVELYPDREAFAIRTTGLPVTGIQGVCFGRTLASMSPGPERFNLGMTLWHELAHVFHLQLSRSRVPRWFTEGLAEHETLARRAEWKREHDPELVDALRGGRLPKVAEMNRAFTRAEELRDIAVAYYASSRILTMLAREDGAAPLARALRAWGDGKSTAVALEEGLGAGPAALDQRFRDWVTRDLARFAGRFVPLGRPGPLARAAADAAARPKDAVAQVRLALALFRDGEAERAGRAAAAALALEPTQPDALYLSARIALRARQPEGAARALAALLRAGHDGYVVRMALAEVARARRDPAAERRELEAAHALDPSGAEALERLVAGAAEAGDVDRELELLARLAPVVEHEARVHRRLARLLAARGRWREAVDAAEAGVHADVLALESHLAHGEALLGAGLAARARHALETALLCEGRPADRARVHEGLARAYRALGDGSRAAEHERAAQRAR
ncbi:MAG: tetratricopeptide repeat protein [Polyangiaceae bacterium]|nr:tetratricopeptide repeat protein [Polyangiaceae bacterium]